jgi:hypothetical protein
VLPATSLKITPWPSRRRHRMWRCREPWRPARRPRHPAPPGRRGAWPPADTSSRHGITTGLPAHTTTALRIVAGHGFRLPPTLANDGLPSHPGIRGIVADALHPQRVAAPRGWLTGVMRRRVAGLAGRLRAGEPVDLYASLAADLPLLVLARLVTCSAGGGRRRAGSGLRGRSSPQARGFRRPPAPRACVSQEPICRCGIVMPRRHISLSKRCPEPQRVSPSLRPSCASRRAHRRGAA